MNFPKLMKLIWRWVLNLFFNMFVKFISQWDLFYLYTLFFFWSAHSATFIDFILKFHLVFGPGFEPTTLQASSLNYYIMAPRPLPNNYVIIHFFRRTSKRLSNVATKLRGFRGLSNVDGRRRLQTSKARSSRRRISLRSSLISKSNVTGIRLLFSLLYRQKFYY